MCGIAGFFKGSSVKLEDQKTLLKRMSSTIQYRGPDSSGEWIDPDANIAVAHRRLSILDLSPAGHQPMISPSGRYVITYNGEVYNHLDLRSNLENINWKGHSDTETLLAGFDAWGITSTIKKTVGMFAMAVWDRECRELSLIRDRMGEKPLYFGWQQDTFLFASELKPLRVHPSFLGDIDRDSLNLYLRHGYITAPYSIYRGISKLIPGTILTIDFTTPRGELPDPVPYWSLYDIVKSGRENTFIGSDKEAVDELEKILLRSVKGQMISDVPLGAFLSGGVDSSTIVALMQAQSSKPVRTFSIGFREDGYDEAVYAKEVARHLGTNHTELYVTPKDAMELIPDLPSMYDEPFGDSSAIPTFLVSRLAKQDVTVSLSGDGGDELFGGYGRYPSVEALWSKISRIPFAARLLAAHGMKFLATDIVKPVVLSLNSLLSGEGVNISNLYRAEALAEYLGCKDQPACYHTFVSGWRYPDMIVLNAKERLSPLTGSCPMPDFQSFTESMMYTDMLSFLHGDILTKVDRAAMAVSLETRVPLLDHRIVEFSWRLPFDVKVKGNTSKWALREVLYRYVPKKLIERPKMGFGVPVDRWMRHEFRDWAEELLSEKRIREDTLFDPRLIRNRWNEHLSGHRNWKDSLWYVLSFQAWKGSIK
jgi:asparagine synthase (glutamine-hydrolysing)